MSSRHVPIAAHRETLLWALENRSALVVVGETGCGKSTQLPKYLIEAGWAAPPRCVVSTQPRALAALELATRVAGELGCDGVGGPVGYAARFEERWCPERTRLKFTTDGWLLREALFDPLFAHYSVVVVDEAHERSLATDLLLGLLKKAMRARAARGDALRVVVMSATADADAFERFFGVDDTAVAVVDGRQYAVDVFFAESPRGADYVAAAAEAVERAHASERRLEAAILVFLPGAREVEECCRLLRAALRDPDRPADVLALHAASPGDHKKRALARGTGKYRKVVVATNVAETSLTIPDVAVVVDPGLCRLPVFDEAAGAEVLATTVCSRASAVQRAGRAGRTGPGKCYRLYTEAAFASDLFPERTPPASSRSELSWALLQLKALGVDNVLEFDLLSPLPETLLLLALEELLALGALDAEARLTAPLGERLALAPAEPRLARVLLASLDEGCASEVLDYAAVLAPGRPLRNLPTPRSQAQRDAQNEKTRAFRDDLVSLDGDHATYGACLRRFLELRDARADPLPFCAARGLDVSALRGAARVRPKLEKWLAAFAKSDGTALASCGDDPDPPRRALVAGFFARAARFAPDATYRTLRADREVALHPQSIHAEFGTPPDYVCFCDFALDDDGATVARHASRVDPKWLLAAGESYYHLRK